MKDTELQELQEIALLLNEHNEDIVLCGGMGIKALSYHYKFDVGPTYTEDFDLLLERRKFKSKSLLVPEKDRISDLLRSGGFKDESHSLPLDGGLNTEKWFRDDSEFYIEFLTEDKNKNVVEISGVHAQGLSYFSMSLDHHVAVKLPNGATLKVASPPAMICHKGLTFNARRQPSKKYKDLYYIAYLVDHYYALDYERVSTDLESLKIHSKWLTTFKKNMASLQEEIKSDSDLIEKIKASDQQESVPLNTIIDVFSELSSI